MSTISTGDDLRTYIRDIPDFPKKGIVFKDITPLLKDSQALNAAVSLIAEPFIDSKITQVICVEARGFIFGSAVAAYLKAGFVPVRKKGKLPYKTFDQTYDLEYGQDVLCIHQDALDREDNVLIVDDLLATGGTVAATANLVKELNAQIIGVACLIELGFLNARKKLSDLNVHSVIKYDS